MGTRRKIKNHTSETEASSSPFDDAFVEPSRAMRGKNALVSVGVAMSHADVRLNQRGLYSFTRTSAPTSLFFKQKTAYDVGLGIPAEPLFRSGGIASALAGGAMSKLFGG